MLLLDDGKEALFFPHSYEEFFTMKKYWQKLGKDYNKIVFYLCTISDFGLHKEAEPSGGSSNKRSQLQKCFHTDYAMIK